MIFWTPDTGAHVVRGPINAAWDKLGGSSGALGVPSDDETYDGAVVSQKFTGGQVSYDARTKKFTTEPPELADQLGDVSIPEDPVVAINAARRAVGGPLGPLGATDGEPYKIGSDGLGQDFVNGKIFYSPDTGANVVTGQVLAKYESVGGPEGDLGFPITGEVDGGVAPASRMSSFAAADKPVIFWTPDYGAVIVRGAMNAAWEKLGGATGALGAPVSDQSQNGDVITQKFSGGALTYNTATKKFTTEPGNLAPQLVGLEVPGQQAPQATPSSQAADSGKGTGFRWTWWWLLAIVPVLLVIGVVALAVARNRRRGGDDDDLFGPPGVDPDDRDYGTEPTGGDDGREDALFGDRYAREGLGSLGSTVPPAPASPPEGYDPGRASFWGGSAHPEHADVPSYEEQDDPDAVDTAPTRVPTPTEVAAVDGPPDIDADAAADHDAEADQDADHDAAADHDAEVDADVDAAHELPVADEPQPEPEPEPVPVFERDPMTDTGRHARIDIDEPAPMGTALHLPLDDPDEAPDGYPVKADTRSGLYWTPGSADYAGAPAQIWFATEEIARTNGFVRGS